MCDFCHIIFRFTAPDTDASKNIQIPIVLEFDVVARFRETIPMVKSVSSFEI